MRLKSFFVVAQTILIIMLLSACNMPQPAPAPTQAPETPSDTGIQYQFVTNKLLIPNTQAQVQAYSLNIDGDPQQQPDNLVGKLLTLLASAVPDLAIQSTVDQAVNTGQIISLHVVKADDLKNAQGVSWSIFQGQRTKSAPSLDGSDKFLLDSSAPVNAPIIGTLTNGHFFGGPGTARIQVFLMGQPVDLELIGVRLEADLSVMGCSNGKLGGAVTVDEFREKLFPSITEGLNQIIKTDQDVANKVLPIFDSDRNGIITVQEMENNPLLNLAAAPDLDLLDASGKFNPDQDGVKDSYSVGLGFTCVPATFSTPGQ
jgi:hypothetical protein